MASVFSYYTAPFGSSSNREDHVTQSPRAIHCLHSPHHILDFSSMVKRIRLLIATIVNPHIRNAPHPFMEPRRMTPTCPRGNQGGSYDTLQHVATRSAHAGIRRWHRRLRRAE
jgi:hypothetical protein